MSNNDHPFMGEDFMSNKKSTEEHGLEAEPEASEGEKEFPEPSNEEKLTAELKETHDRLLRVAAEFENYKKIAQREQINSVKFANENLIVNMLPVIDNLEQAISVGKKANSSKDLIVGIEMVLKQLCDSLEKFGVEFFSAVGENFDPARHEALSEREDESVDPGVVIEQFQKGCLLNGRLLRAARVVVSKKSGN